MATIDADDTPKLPYYIRMDASLWWFVWGPNGYRSGPIRSEGRAQRLADKLNEGDANRLF